MTVFGKNFFSVEVDVPGNRHSASFDGFSSAVDYFIDQTFTAGEGRVKLVYEGPDYEDD